MGVRRLSEETEKRLAEAIAAPLQSWACIEAEGDRIVDYLQTQLTQDLRKLSPQQALHAALLTPQAKAVAELYLVMPASEKRRLWLLVARDRIDAAIKRLSFFSIGWRVRFQKQEAVQVWALQGARTNEVLCELGLPQPDNRWLAASANDHCAIVRMPFAEDGVWIVAETGSLGDRLCDRLVDEEEIEALRILAGIPRFGVEWDESTPVLFAGLWETDAVSFEKGCYVGQEVVSRMRWRGKVRKHLVRVAIDRTPARIPCAIGDPAIGELRSAACDAEGKCRGLALVPRKKAKLPLLADGSCLQILGPCGWKAPDWPELEESS